MLTQRQKEVLDFIREYINQNGVGPTLDEISTHFQMGSASAAHQHVEALKRKGFLKKLPHQTRAMSLLQESDDMREIPLVGRIALGEPIDNFDEVETIKVPKLLMSGEGQYYALEAFGNSMNQDGILNGDILIIKETSTPDNGDIVVAQTAEYKATLKRFYNHGDKIELRPKSSNSTYRAQYYPAGEIEVQGKFCGLLRKGD
ncbi:MAG: transcriptional repressor LexA [Patescibacteria group bacterium]|nr:transcriptional repressor LexA [Patescibacteria group bacterium]